MQQAKGAFAIEKWEETPVLEHPGASFVRTVVHKMYSGDVAGTSVAELVMARAAAGSMAYCGFERLEVTVGGSKGTFTLHHNAQGNKDGGTATVTVMANSGAGALEGMCGTATIAKLPDGSHTFTLDYTLA